MPIGIYKHKPHSEETKRKISINNVKYWEGKHLSKETRLKMSLLHKGKHHSEETKMKMGESGKGKHTGSKSHFWQGGKFINKKGYVFLHSPDHPYKKQNYVPEHRLIVEKKIGRYLKPEEVVHHINSIKDDNRIENLILFKNNGAQMKHNHQKQREFICKFCGKDNGQCG